MYYRMTRLHFTEEALEGLVGWMGAQEQRLEDIDGLLTWDLARGGATDGMVIASYRDQAAYEAAAGEVGAIFEEMSMHLTDAPHGHDGTVVFSMDL
jgi:hypothetical protein